MIKVVIFDMGGVVVNLDIDRCISNFKNLAGFNAINDYLDRCHHRGFISDMEAGNIDAGEFFERCIRLSRPGTTAETIEECFCSLLVELNPKAVQLIKELKGRYDMFILSNNNPITRAKFERMLVAAGIPGPETFRKEYYSYEMKLLKPGREIYEAVVKEIGVQPEEILFIDDSVTNVDGAEAVGIRTVFLQQGMDIREEVMKVIDNQ